VAHRVPTLQPDQKVIWDAVSESIDSSAGMTFFLDDPGGAVKMYLAETLLNYTRGSGHIGLAVGSSAIAATLMPLGRTAHSRFRILIESTPTSFCGFTQSTEVAKMLKKTKLIVWDEASMAHRHCFEAVDRSIVDVMGPEVASQLTWLVCGDFRQVPTVEGFRGSIGGCLVGISWVRDCKKIQKTQTHETCHRVILWVDFSVGRGSAVGCAHACALARLHRFVLLSAGTLCPTIRAMVSIRGHAYGRWVAAAER